MPAALGSILSSWREDSEEGLGCSVTEPELAGGTGSESNTLATTLFKEAFWLQAPQLMFPRGDKDTDPHTGQREQTPNLLLENYGDQCLQGHLFMPHRLNM